jgi:hypothetical protein
MNVFILDTDPVVAAQQQCNKHVVKMILESAQLLVTAFPPGTTPYKHTHFNHPCGKWMRSSVHNFKWLLVHGVALCEEYTKRYGKTHKTESVIYDMLDANPDLPDIGLTPFVRAIKEPWKTQTMHMSITEAYRQYYIGDKARFARWAPRAVAPEWWPFKEETQ